MRIDSDLNPQLQSMIFDSLLLHMKAERRRAPYAPSDAGSRHMHWDGLAKDLLKLGLSKTAADTLVSWVTVQAEQSRTSPAKIRILHPMEREFISVEAYGYLLELYRLGLIGPPQLEMLIENCAFLTSLPATRDQVAKMALRAFSENLEMQGLGSSH
ncbi:MAG: DUF494 family protein [Fibrobacteres bacterium]|nr:DUF494 family protein [Fibrobacterota bacterium]